MSDAVPSPAKAVQTPYLAPVRTLKGARKDTLDLIAKVDGRRLGA
jgi:hypothetical protein